MDCAKKLLYLLHIIFSSAGAFAFPDLIRHGYNNCLTCHVSPGGGSLLSPYGRSLSKEALSQTAFEGEENYFAISSAEPSENFLMGGDFRVLYRYLNNPTTEDGLWIPMQSELIGAWAGLQNWIFQVSLNAERVSASSNQTKMGSRTHFIMYNAPDEWSEWRIRLGKFPVAFGLMIPEHFASTRAGIGFEQGRETYNIELSYVGEEWSHFAYWSAGRFDARANIQDVGPGLTMGYNFHEKLRLGVSAFFPETTTHRKALAGPFLLWSFAEHWFWLAEIDYQLQSTKANNTLESGVFSYQKIGKEVVKGVLPFFEYELNFSDLSLISTKAQVYGIGIQYFPRPHWQFDLVAQKKSSSQYPGVWTDYAYFLFHYYI